MLDQTDLKNPAISGDNEIVLREYLSIFVRVIAFAYADAPASLKNFDDVAMARIFNSIGAAQRLLNSCPARYLQGLFPEHLVGPDSEVLTFIKKTDEINKSYHLAVSAGLIPHSIENGKPYCDAIDDHFITLLFGSTRYFVKHDGDRKYWAEWLIEYVDSAVGNGRGMRHLSVMRDLREASSV